MEYDDSDFNGQNCHLAGEESSKFSHVLCPYALPKFDFDDSLQGHLRFDSLAENEVYLGISNQEDNQWIEDFSRVSNGIGFNRSAAESCTISMHNNVWSEATSSESVEMLLKSVGQEEMVMGDIIYEDSDAGNEPGSLTKQTEPGSEKDDKTGDTKDSELVIPLNELQDEVTRLSECASGQYPNLKCTSELHEARKSVDVISTGPDWNATSEMCSSNLNEDNLGIYKVNDANTKGFEKSVDESHTIRMQEEASVSVVVPMDIDSSLQNVFDSVGTSSQNIISTVSNLNEEQMPQHVSDCCSKNTTSLPPDIYSHVKEQIVQINEHSTVDVLHPSVLEISNSNMPIPCISPSIESLEACALEASVIESGKTSSLLIDGDAELQNVEGSSKDKCSKIPGQNCVSDLVVFSKSRDCQQPFDSVGLSKESPIMSESDCDPEGHASIINSSQEGIHGNIVVEMDPDVPVTHAQSGSAEEKLLFSDTKTAQEVKFGSSESFSLSGAVNNASEQYDKISCNNTGSLSGLNEAPLSPKLQDTKESLNILGGVGESSNVLSLPLAGSVQVDTSSDQCNVNEFSFHKGTTLESLSVSSDTAVENVVSIDCERREESPFLGRDIIGNSRVTLGSELGFTSENTTTTDHDTLEGTPLLSEMGATTDNTSTHTKNEQSTSLVVLGSELDERKDGTEVGASAEASLLAHRDSSKMSIGLSPVSEVDKGVTHGSTEIPLQIVSQSISVVNIPNVAEKENLFEQMDASDTCEESSLSKEAPMNHYDSTNKEGESAKPVSENQEESAIVKSSEMAPLKASASQCAEHSQKSDKNGGELMAKCVPLLKVNDGAADAKVHSHVKENDGSKEEKSFTFDVSSSSPLEDQSKTFPSFSVTQKIGESPSAPGGGKLDSKMFQETSTGSPHTLGGKTTNETAQDKPKRKRRQSSAKSGKENVTKGSHEKVATVGRLSEKGGTLCVPTSDVPGKILPSEELKPYGKIEHSAPKPSGVIAVPTSQLDLNNSSVPSALFQQPFTDLQQVQLRAQIFVYGSLIQGAVPDEACMISAFGISETGRRVWESSWHACVERLHVQRTHANDYESPAQSYSGVKVSNQPVRHGSVQGKVSSSTVGGANSKSSSLPLVSPMMPLSSPLWAISSPSDGLQSGSMAKGPFVDYHPPLSPLHAYQTSPLQNYVGRTTLLSQAPGPWFASPQPYTLDNSRLSACPIAEAVKLTPIKESSTPIYSGSKPVSSVSVAHSGSSGGFMENAILPEMNKAVVKSGQYSTDAKSRKRKKVPVSENTGPISFPIQSHPGPPLAASVVTSILSSKISVSDGHLSLHAPNQFGLMPSPIVPSHFSTSVAVVNTASPTPVGVKGNSDKLPAAVSPTRTSDLPARVDQTVEAKFSILEETLSKVEEAKLQAENAATHAASAFSHCQELWNQLDKHKNSRLISDVEAKLASAAVAIAAAASVAKAAAAAANVASNAAVQAKLMADEVLPLCESVTLTSSLPNLVNDLVKTTPASILMGGEMNTFPSSIREAARRRVDATSVATKHAENLNAIVKAAELAAVAVSQVGKIVAMGDTLPLNELVEAGPEGYWNALQVPNDRGIQSNNTKSEHSTLNINGGVPGIPEKLEEESSGKKTQTIDCDLRGGFRDISDDDMRIVDCISGPAACRERDASVQRGLGASNLPKTIGVVSESQIGSIANSLICEDRCGNEQVAMGVSSITEGCQVEVFKEGDSCKDAWFSAKVLSLKDGKAFVSYTELLSTEGTENLKEWVPLASEGFKTPIIRIPHPMTIVRFEGTRKRHRTATRDCTWSVGDRVDAWMQDCWREGVVTEKNKKDETMLTVHFLAKGDASVVRSWHLRPTLIWKDGVWIESPCSKESSSQGDTPQEKRLKLGGHFIEGKEKGKTSKNVVLEAGKNEESRLLPLSLNERAFNIGKSSIEDSKPEPSRTTRSGLQKEGSRVIFGIPKPGKKKKFMEVSKHYVSDRSSKNNPANDSSKFMKFSERKGTGIGGWRSNFRMDSKEKQAPEPKSKVLKHGKGQSASGRSLPLKENLLASASGPRDNIIEDKSRNGVNSDDNDSQQNIMDPVSFSKSEAGKDSSVIFSKLSHAHDAPNKKSTLNAKSEQLKRAKVAPGGGKLSNPEAKDKSIPGLIEPRRSNRRIQPTSRLLEGLQSSLIGSKLPAASLDKNQRNQNRGTTKG